jgi:anti-anti-sigma factor
MTAPVLADVHFEEQDGNPVARVRGEIDLSNVAEVGSTLQNAVAQSAAGMVVDFSETQYLDSAGVHFVFELGKRLRDRGQRLYLVVPEASPVAGMLDIVNVGSLARRCGTLDGALEGLRAHASDASP